MEHIILCFISDPVGVQLARRIGIDRITVEIDYPHSDSTWPRAPEKLAAEFASTDLTDDEIDRITYKNAMGFFQYDPFAHRPREQCTVGALRTEAIGVDVEPKSVTGAARKSEREGRVTITDLAARAR